MTNRGESIPPGRPARTAGPGGFPLRAVLGSLAVAVLLSAGIVAQSGSPAPSFDVADVHVRPHSSNPRTPQMSGGVLRDGRYDLRNATMLRSYSPLRITLQPPISARRAHLARARTASTSSPRRRMRTPQDDAAADAAVAPGGAIQAGPAQRYEAHSGLRADGRRSAKLKAGNAGRPDPKKRPAMPPQDAPVVDRLPLRRCRAAACTMDAFAVQLRGFGGGYITGARRRRRPASREPGTST